MGLFDLNYMSTREKAEAMKELAKDVYDYLATQAIAVAEADAREKQEQIRKEAYDQGFKDGIQHGWTDIGVDLKAAISELRSLIPRHERGEHGPTTSAAGVPERDRADTAEGDG